MDLIREFEQEQIKDIARPQLRAGDVVRVAMKVTEGEKTRRQIFEGTVLGIRGGGPSTTFTVRREVGKFGVERIFPLYSPLITSIEIVRRQKVRRAKLTYLRNRARRRVKDDELSMQRHIAEEKERELEKAKTAKREAEAKAAAEKKEEKPALEKTEPELTS